LASLDQYGIPQFPYFAKTLGSLNSVVNDSVQLTYGSGTENSEVFCLFLIEGVFTSFFKIKVIKKLDNRRNQGFSYYFCLMMKGSGSESVQMMTDPEGPKSSGSTTLF
jgi:hypothetical protein